MAKPWAIWSHLINLQFALVLLLFTCQEQPPWRVSPPSIPSKVSEVFWNAWCVVWVCASKSSVILQTPNELAVPELWLGSVGSMPCHLLPPLLGFFPLLPLKWFSAFALHLEDLSFRDSGMLKLGFCHPGRCKPVPCILPLCTYPVCSLQSQVASGGKKTNKASCSKSKWSQKRQEESWISTLQELMEGVNPGVTSLYPLGGTKESGPGLGQGVHDRIGLLGRSAQVRWGAPYEVQWQ